MIRLHPPINKPIHSIAINLQELIQLILTLPPIERIAIIKAILQSPDLNLRQFYDDLSSELETAFILSDKQLTQHIMEARNRKANIPLDNESTPSRLAPKGVPGQHLLQFAGFVPENDLQQISQTITEDCSKVDPNEW